MKKSSWLIIIIILIALGITAEALYLINQRYSVSVPNDYFPASIPSPSSVTKPPNQQQSTSSPINLPAGLLLKVPFTPQAPTGNWDKIHNEDCEEASSIMANAFYNGPQDTKLDPTYVEEQLTNLTDWEMRNFGYNLDISSEETAEVIEANYGLQTKILYSYTEQDIKNELSQNHLVLIPENGQMLENPNYKSPGPIYHMLVIRGFNPNFIITNDPGTRNGQNYPYNFQALYAANGDWSHTTNSVDLTKKNIIVVWK